MLRLCTAYPQDSRNGSRSHREPALLGRRGTLCVSVSQHSVVPSVKPCNLDFTSLRGRLSLHRLGIRSGGVYERIEYADVEAKKTTNCNDEAEGAQTEIHRSFANEGAEPTGPRPCRFSAAAVWHVSPFAARCASGSIGAPMAPPRL